MLYGSSGRIGANFVALSNRRGKPVQNRSASLKSTDFVYGVAQNVFRDLLPAPSRGSRTMVPLPVPDPATPTKGFLELMTLRFPLSDVESRAVSILRFRDKLRRKRVLHAY